MNYLILGDISIFMEEFKKNPSSVWIIKPSNSCQGQGIVLVNKMKQIKKLNFMTKTSSEQNDPNNTYVVSKYLENPYLICEKKFDLRIYILVTSFHPLKVWLFKQGFCRFCNEKYSVDVNEIDNIYMHLTNVAVQKKYEKYNSVNGGKWNIKNLRLYMEMNHGFEKTKNCFNEINNIVINSLKAVQGVIHSDKHCFECYGYDIIIDKDLKPWLIEVNSSPSLCTTTIGDRILKKNLISDIIK